MGAVRLHFSSTLPTGFGNAVMDALREHGCFITHDADAPLVSFFQSDVEEVLDRARDAATSGENQGLLAVCVDTRPPPPLYCLKLLKSGVNDVLTWDEGSCIGVLVARLKRWEAIQQIIESEQVRSILIGVSTAWKRVLRRVVEVAAFGDSPILITGETGTGKELVARLVHEVDRRAPKGDFVVLDCSTIVKELSGSEFFGHEKGAFTGAVGHRNGAFAMANGGTLFLDELGELPLLLQAELLRVVQEKTYKRVGGSVWQTTDFRLVSATNRCLEQEQQAGHFRADLLYRVAGWTVSLPPLRERREDIVPLASHFLTQKLGYTPALDPSVRECLVSRNYPGNIRELRQLCTRIAQRHVGSGTITIGDLGEDLGCETLSDSGTWCDVAFETAIERAVSLGFGLKEIGKMAEDLAVRVAIASEHGSLQAAARRLGVTDRALQLRRAQQRSSDVSALAPEAPDVVRAS